MKRPKYCEDHECAPQAWRHTPNMTGDYDMDASIMFSKNPALETKLSMYLTKNNAYMPKTGYKGYRGYHGDD